MSISAALERFLPGFGPDFDHCHLALTSNHRWTEEGELIVYGVETNFAAYTKQTRLKPDDGGVGEWLQVPDRATLIDTAGRRVRPDKAMASEGGHEVLPSGGHVAVRWRPTVLPSSGQQDCPR